MTQRKSPNETLAQFGSPYDRQYIAHQKWLDRREERRKEKRMPRLANCRTCGATPVRVSKDLYTWMECPTCGQAGPKSHVISDDYAYTNTEEYWNTQQR